MQVETFQGGFDKNLSYLVWCDETKYAGLIDASVEPLEILEFIESHNLILEKILITHTHHDHIHYLSDFLYKYPMLNVYLHSNPINKPNNFIPLEHNQVITIGNSLFTTLHTPGHFADSVCFWNKEEHLIFTGDTIFIGRTGRTVSNHSDINDLYDSVYNIIFSIPDETMILPGHHYGYSEKETLKFNKETSKFFQCDDKNEFKKVMEEFEKNRKK